MRRALLLAAGPALLVVAVLVAQGRLQPKGYTDTRGARVVHYTLTSRVMGRKLAEVGVIPPGASAKKRPLVVFLHGRHDPGPLHFLGGDVSGPQTVLNDAFFAGLAGLGDRAPVVVALNGGAHSYYHDRKDGRWATMLLREAIPDAARRFHTDGRIAIGGISMGGYGALHLASLRPKEFCAVGGHSAALWTSGGASAPGAFDDAEDYARNDVFAAARRGAFANLPVWIDGGDRDPFREADAEFARLVHVPDHISPGGHEGAYWHAHMAEYLRFYASACHEKDSGSPKPAP